MVLSGPFALLLHVATAPAADDAARAADVLVSLAIDGPTGPDGGPLFPHDLRILGVGDGVVVVDGSFFCGDPVVDELADELRRETFVGALTAAGVQGGVRLVDATGNELGAFLHRDPPPQGRPVRRRAPGAPRPTTKALPFGAALAGVRIGLSAGHGWVDNGSGFGTQRSNFQFSSAARGITEDFFTAEVMTNQLVPLLQNMGAEVVLVRAPDHDTGPEVVVDAVAAHVVEGSFVSVSGGVGGSSLQASADGEGRVVLPIPTTPRRTRRVAIRFPRIDGSAAAVVTVVHAGGARTVNLDQTQAGGFWRDLGAFPLDADSRVEIAAGPAVGRLVVDAVQVGGGTHDSGHPWWQMAAKSYVPERGAPDVPAGVTGKGDVTIRPSYAEEFDIDAFVSVHANASGAGQGSTANGLSIYRYNCSDARYPDHSLSTSATDCDDPVGSTDLIDEVFAATLGELRASWDPNFGDRGRRVANFGELRDLVDAPGILIETAFFDNLANPSGSPPPRMADNKALHDPRWRESFATGVARGLARFFTPGADAPPARPTRVVAKNVDGGLLVSWAPVPGAVGYKVYTAIVSDDGARAFDDGVVVTDAAAAFSDVARGTTLAFKVAAMNDSGEGYASAVVAARVGTPVALLVDAYDRRDAFVQDIDNTLSYAFEHGAALAAALGPGGFDGADDDALGDGVALTDYAFVDWYCGKDSTEHRPVDKDQQSALAAYVDRGGRLFLSGEEVGYALVETSDDPADEAFLADVLGALYVSDDAETYEATVLGADVDLDDGSAGVYEVVYPDVIAAAAGATVVGTWPDGTGAAVQKGNVLFLATPFEALVPHAARAAVMVAVVDALAVPLPAEGEGEGEEGEGEEGEGEGGEGEEGEEGEGEGEGEEGEDDVERIVVQNSVVDGGCGCSSEGGGADRALPWLALFALRRRRSRASRPVGRPDESVSG